MSDDAPPAPAEIDFAPHASQPDRLVSLAARVHNSSTLHCSTTDPAPPLFTIQQQTTEKLQSVINVSTRLSHAYVCYRIDDCDIHNGYKVLVNTS